MMKYAILVLAFLLTGPAHALTQNSSGITQNNTSGLTQNMVARPQTMNPAPTGEEQMPLPNSSAPIYPVRPIVPTALNQPAELAPAAPAESASGVVPAETPSYE